MAQDLLVPAVAVLIEILHRLAREEIVVIEIAQRERFEYVVVAILGVLQIRLVAAMRDQDFPVLMMRLVGGNVPFVLRPTRNRPVLNQQHPGTYIEVRR